MKRAFFPGDADHEYLYPGDNHLEKVLPTGGDHLEALGRQGDSGTRAPAITTHA